MAIKSVTGSGNMSDSEIIAQLVNRYEHAFVMRRNLDSITNRTMEHIPVKAQGDDGIDVGTASIIIKQQARRIDELERANAELRGQSPPPPDQTIVMPHKCPILQNRTGTQAKSGSQLSVSGESDK